MCRGLLKFAAALSWSIDHASCRPVIAARNRFDRFDAYDVQKVDGHGSLEQPVRLVG